MLPATVSSLVDSAAPESMHAASPEQSASQASLATFGGGRGALVGAGSRLSLSPDARADLLEKLDSLRVSCDDLMRSQTNLARGREHVSFCIQVSTRPVGTKDAHKRRRRTRAVAARKSSGASEGHPRRRSSAAGGGDRNEDRRDVSSGVASCNLASTAASTKGREGANAEKNETAVEFKGAPFGFRMRRFAYGGLHPDLRAQGCSDTLAQKDQLSPALYSPRRQPADASTHREGVVKPSYYFRLPSPSVQLLESRKEAQRSRWLAPGRYELADWLAEASLRPSSRKAPGACMPLGRRFVTDQQTTSCVRGKIYREPLDRLMTVPGPGAYDAPARQAVGNRFHDGPGIMSTVGGRTEAAQPLASNLPPGAYQIPSSIDQLLSKVVSLKGPYAVFTGSRGGPVCFGSGHFKTDHQAAAQKMKHLGPGAYNPYPTKWEGPHRSFRRVTEAEREHLRNRTSKPTYPPLVRPNDNPGPGQYDLGGGSATTAPATSPLSGGTAASGAVPTGKQKTSVPLSLVAINKAMMWRCQYGFNSTTERKDKFTHERWGYSANPVGVGRYNVAEASQRFVHVNGHCSVFNSSFDRGVFAVDTAEARAARSWETERARKAKKLEAVRTRLLGPATAQQQQPPPPPPKQQSGAPTAAAAAAATAAIGAAAAGASGAGEQRK